MNRSVSLTRLPRALFSAEQVRAIDRHAIEQAGIPGSELMQRAASVVLHAILERWPQVLRLLIVCGTGNNGGDGYLVAALAAAQGLNVRVLEPGAGDRLGGDALSARQSALAAGIRCEPLRASEDLSLESARADTVLVDALLGIGLRGSLRPEYRVAIEWINGCGLPVVAVDVPSGLNSDTGVAVATLLPPRRPASHKGDCGHVLVVGGDVGYGGAALMAAEAAARAGAGTVSLLTRAVHVTAMLTRRPEIMARAIESPNGDDAELVSQMIARASVVVIGPGLGRTAWSAALLRLVLQETGLRVPLVVDADALNLLAEKRAQLGELSSTGVSGLHRANWILTPHPGEAARLLGCSMAQVQEDRFSAVRRLQQLWGGVCLLKGAGSLLCFVAPTSGAPMSCMESCLELCTEGNPGMASGGMGDILSGIIGGFVAQGLSLVDSLRCGVCIHGESADLAAAADGERGTLATDLLPHLRHLVNNGQN